MLYDLKYGKMRILLPVLSEPVSMKVDQKTRISESLRKRFIGVGELLRAARIEKRLTQDDAATACGVSRQTVSRIEQGDPSVAWGQVGRFAEAMGVATLLGGTAPAEPNAAGRRVRAPRIKPTAPLTPPCNL